MKGGKVVSVWLLLLPFVFSLCQTWAQSYTDLHLDAQQVIWTDLSYEAKSFAVKVKTDINLASCKKNEFESLRLSHPQYIPLPTASSEVYRIDVNTNVDRIFSPPVELLEQTWFEPMQATALYRIRLRRGKDDFKKIYWFTGQGVHRLRREPGSKKEALLPPDQWGELKNSFYGFSLTQLGCPQVTDPSVLIYIVSSYFNSKSKNPLTLYLFGKKQLHQVRLWVDESHRVSIDYIERKGDIKVPRQGKIEVLRVKLEAQPVRSDQDDPEKFSFLGLRRNISIDVNPESRIPVQVRGTIPLVGNVTLKLSEVKVRKQ